MAVLDCSDVDPNQLAEIAGGSGSLHLIEVPYTFEQVDSFRDDLVQELRDAGVPGDVLVNSTLEGRTIEVIVEDLKSLPPSFGSDIPDDIYEAIEGEISREG